MIRRLAITLLSIALLPFAGNGQSFQTKFDQVKFDRSIGPGTLHGDLNVEASTGAAILNVPLGPGIGARGLHFVPSIQVRSSAQLWSKTAPIDPNYAMGVPPYLESRGGDAGDIGLIFLRQSFTETNFYASGGSGSLDPGSFSLVYPDSRNALQVHSIVFPDGGSSFIGGQVPAGTDYTKILRAFGRGVEEGWSIAPFPYRTSDGDPRSPSGDAVGIGSHGELIIGLTHATLAPLRAIDDPQTVYRWITPTRMLVIRGDTAFEFAFRLPAGGGAHISLPRTANEPSGRDKMWLQKAMYSIVRMANRFGDEIRFDHGAFVGGMTTEGVTNNRLDYTARWYRNGQPVGVSIAVKFAQQTTLTHSVPGAGGLPFQKAFRVSITYSGMTPAPTYSYTYYNPTGLSEYVSGPISLSADAWQGNTGNFDTTDFSDGLPLEIKDETSGETYGFEYTTAYYQDVDRYDFWPLLQSVKYPTGRVTTLQWSDYPYRPNLLPVAWGGYLGDLNRLNARAFGVTQISEFDPATNTSRVTKHTRVVPIPVGQMDWSSTRFYDAVTYPDGTSKVFYFVEPTLSGDTSLQTLAHLNHHIQELREYPDDNWMLDVDRPAGQSQASIITVHDRLDVRRIGNPEGSLGILGNEAYSTRTRRFDAETQSLEVAERTSWDGLSSWKINTTERFVSGQTPDLRVDYPSKELGSGMLISYPNRMLTAETQTTVAFDPSTWLNPRPVLEEGQVTDLSANVVGGTGYTIPPVSKQFSTDRPLLIKATQGAVGGAQVETTFSYKGESTNSESDWGLLQSVVVRDPGNTAPLSGQVGVQAYEYDDTFGFMNSIQPKGVSWNLSQVQDALGRVTSQTGADQVTTAVSWDGSGRIISMQTGNELPTNITYPASVAGRGLVVTKGSQSSELHYDGFGRLILEKRVNEGGTPSYKVYGYDLAGRLRAETVWDSTGSDDESGLDNLVQAAPYYRPGSTTCTKQDLEGNCLSWRTIPAESGVNPAKHKGTLTEYDWRGRVTRVVDPNGTEVKTSYSGGGGNLYVQRTLKQALVTSADGATQASMDLVTSLTYDIRGKLVSIQDAKNQVTRYGYDAAGRLRKVEQVDPMTSGTQVRTWKYDDLGRLTEMSQPESGLTRYELHTVTGKPTRTIYAAGSASEKQVDTTYDPLDRVIGVTSLDGTITQSYTFDNGPTDGTTSRGKLLTATSQGSKRTFHYDASGRIDSLAITIPGITTPFNLGYTYNPSYGFLTARTYPDGKVQYLTYSNSMGVPQTSSFNNVSLTLGYHPTHWGLTGLIYSNGASMGFTYGDDQTRLASMSPSIPGVNLPIWSYEYDAAGRLKSDGVDQYGYDELGRLIVAYVRDLPNVPGRGIQQIFSYDAFGNRKSLQSWSISNWTAGGWPSGFTTTALPTNGRDLRSYAMTGAEVAAMGVANRIPTSMGGVATGANYDPQGNLTMVYRIPGQEGSSLTLSYDAIGRTTSLFNMANSQVEKYVYDDQGLRVLTEIYQGSAAPENLLKKVIHIYSEARQLLTVYEWVLE